MNRGTVMELSRKKTVVLTPAGQFLHIKRQLHHQVGEEITFSTQPNLRVSRHWLASGLSAAALLLLFIGLWTFRTPPVVAYVTMDINPSVELGLDSKERVRELRAVNDDAEAIIEGLQYRGRDLEAVMTEIADKLVAEHILNLTDAQVVIASVPVRTIEDNWENDVTAKMKEVLINAVGQKDTQTLDNLHITTVSVPAEVREEAKANGVSSGKMAFWLIAQSQGHDLSLETIQTQSLKKIAASWGGVNSVMDDHADRKEKKEDWKKLLEEIKDKKKSAVKSGKANGKDDDDKASGEPKATSDPKASGSPVESPEHSGKPGQAGQSADNDSREHDDDDREHGSKGSKDTEHGGDDKKQSGVKNEDRKKYNDGDERNTEQSRINHKYKYSDDNKRYESKPGDKPWKKDGLDDQDKD